MLDLMYHTKMVLSRIKGLFFNEYIIMNIRMTDSLMGKFDISH